MKNYSSISSTYSTSLLNTSNRTIKGKQRHNSETHGAPISINGNINTLVIREKSQNLQARN